MLINKLLKFIFYLQCNIKKNYRLIEKNENKLLKNKWSLIFNETWINDQILPNYTKMIFYQELYQSNPRYVNEN